MHRMVGERLWVRMPYGDGTNRAWLKEELGSRIRPQWNSTAGRWEVARPHLSTLVNGMVGRFGEVDVFLEYSHHQQCDVRCQRARGDDCQCSCLGVHHGGGAFLRQWTQIGDTLVTSERTVVHYVASPRFTVQPART